METPFVTHMTSEDYEHVYEPAEDSFLMIDALESDLQFIKDLNPSVCVEIGSGSGINITAIANALKTECYFIATDINSYATQTTKKTADVNEAKVDAIQMDLVSSLLPNSIDVLIFNPPYVPTDTSPMSTTQTHDEGNFSESTLDKNLIKSWAGGRDGREVMDRVLTNLDRILSTDGVFYLIALKENNLEDIAEMLRGIQFTTEILSERRIRGEHLFVLKIRRI